MDITDIWDSLYVWSKVKGRAVLVQEGNQGLTKLLLAHIPGEESDYLTEYEEEGMDAVREEEGQELLFAPAEQNAIFETVSYFWGRSVKCFRTRTQI